MKIDHGMDTLMTVFSGMAALMCLLVGLQLFALEARIGQAAAGGLPGADFQFRQWQASVHMGAVMSLGAGALVFLFGLRHQRTAGMAGRRRLPPADPASQALDMESLSVRVFEVDDADRSVEIIAGDPVPASILPPPRPIVWHPLDETEDAPPTLDPGRAVNPADSIVQSIREAAAHGRPAARESFLDRLRRRRRG
jgi:hypothetical protein